MLSNAEIADALARIADLLETQDADGFRVRAYRRGARCSRRSRESSGARPRVAEPGSGYARFRATAKPTRLEPARNRIRELGSGIGLITI